MRYETAASFRSALEDRLKKQTTDVNRLAYLRKQVVFERFLARLVGVAPGRFVLKGALGMEFRGGERGRTTKDMDLGTVEEEEEVTEDILEAAELDLEDYFVFQAERVDRRESASGKTVRYRVKAELAGREFDIVLVDVGLNEIPLWEPDRVQTPGLLKFADLAPVSVPALSLEQQIAEKVHAYTRIYEGGQGHMESRGGEVEFYEGVIRSSWATGPGDRGGLDCRRGAGVPDWTRWETAPIGRSNGCAG